MINQAIKDSKAYKIYLAYATRAATPKKVRNFKKPASPSKKHTLVLEDKSAKKPKRAENGDDDDSNDDDRNYDFGDDEDVRKSDDDHDEADDERTEFDYEEEQKTR
nr:hypothetical protein [Tanacetum cinerariifolium]